MFLPEQVDIFLFFIIYTSETQLGLKILSVIAADRREAAHYSCDTRAQISMPSYV